MNIFNSILEALGLIGPREHTERVSVWSYYRYEKGLRWDPDRHSSIRAEKLYPEEPAFSFLMSFNAMEDDKSPLTGDKNITFYTGNDKEHALGAGGNRAAVVRVNHEFSEHRWRFVKRLEGGLFIKPATDLGKCLKIGRRGRVGLCRCSDSDRRMAFMYGTPEERKQFVDGRKMLMRYEDDPEKQHMLQEVLDQGLYWNDYDVPLDKSEILTNIRKRRGGAYREPDYYDFPSGPAYKEQGGAILKSFLEKQRRCKKVREGRRRENTEEISRLGSELKGLRELIERQGAQRSVPDSSSGPRKRRRCRHRRCRRPGRGKRRRGMGRKRERLPGGIEEAIETMGLDKGSLSRGSQAEKISELKSVLREDLARANPLAKTLEEFKAIMELPEMQAPSTGLGGGQTLAQKSSGDMCAPSPASLFAAPNAVPGCENICQTIEACALAGKRESSSK